MTQTQSRVDDYIARGLDHLWVHASQYNDLAADDGLLVIESGDGIYVSDSKGRRFLDAMSGLWVVAVGHGRSELGEVAKRQIERVAFANPFAYATEPAIDLATKLAEVTPPGIQKIYFVNSGSEAVEAAIRMAKQYHYNRGARRKTKVIARIGSYHGTTAMAMSVNGSSYVDRKPFEPLMPGVVHVENINCAHCPFEKTYPDCDVFCARHIEDEIKFQDPETVAAIIAEPISTANGCWVPQQEYWTVLREICDRHDIVLIADEVINGFGRTGGVVRHPALPDRAGHHDGGEGAVVGLRADRSGDGQPAHRRRFRGGRASMPLSAAAPGARIPSRARWRWRTSGSSSASDWWRTRPGPESTWRSSCVSCRRATALWRTRVASG